MLYSKRVKGQQQRVKKDALWKPLLRNYRSFLRGELSGFTQVKTLWNSDGSVSAEARHATISFMQKLNMPQEMIQNELYVQGLVVTMAHASSRNLMRFFSKIDGGKEVSMRMESVISLFCQIFRENSVKQRFRFFNDGFIQRLWSLFLQEKRDFVSGYLNKLKTTDLEAYNILRTDAFFLSKKIKYAVLPDENLIALNV